MLRTGRSSSMYPFTPTQWQELEHQALVYKYMASGIPVPPDLLLPIRSTYFLNTAPTLPPHFPHHPTLGWSSWYQTMGGRKAEDPEPGRCRRTDGKKWRCSKEAYPDSKYCERHMHRGKNRSRKPVEISPNNNNNRSAAAAHESPYHPHPYYNKEAAYPEAPAGGGGGGGGGRAWELRPLGLGEPKRRGASAARGEYYNGEEEKKHCFVLGADFKLGSSNGGGEEEEERRPVRRFFDEWPRESRDESWMLSSPRTQLSISIPMALHPSQLINGSCERGL